MDLAKSPRLHEDEIHVWTVPVIDDNHETSECLGILDDAERARAARFVYLRDRTRFVQSHGIMRQILASYLDSDPASLVFQRGHLGKPYLHGPSQKPNLHFSLSHSEAYCMVAVRWSHPLGVDIEKVRITPDAINIARNQFAPAETVLLSKLNGSAQRQAFFALWTGKEACIKALGAGLAESLYAIELELDSEGFLRPIAWHEDQSVVRNWSICRLNAPNGYVATVCSLHPFRTLTQLDS